MSYVWVTATTRWGSARIQVTQSVYDLATKKAQFGARAHICVKLRKKLNSNGGNAPFIKWRDITLSKLSRSQGGSDNEVVLPAPLQVWKEEVQTALEQVLEADALNPEESSTEHLPALFDDNELPSNTNPDSDYDNICGCVPSPITTK